jgi:hypothetical protein
MRPQRLLPLIVLFLSACAAPEAPPAEIAAAAEAAPPIMIDRPAQGPNGGPNTDAEWARVTRLQRADILARAQATPEAKARFALMMDCGRYASEYGSRKFFDESNAGLPKDEACLAESDKASAAYYAEADKALTLNEMDRFQYFNSGLIQDRQEFREQGDAAAQRAYLQAKTEACFAAPDQPPGLTSELLTDCPITLTGTPIAK